jgi:lysine-specific demethylase 8
VGEDTPVDVEIGPSYSEGAVKATIRFGDYIKYIQLIDEHQPKYTSASASNYELVYMAQHELFPILGKDITVPHLCSSTKYEGVGHGKLYSSLFWFGPPGCNSTLHYDPCDNLLMQLVGRKKVILYPPQPGIRLGREQQHQNNDSLNNDWYYSGPKYGQQYNTSSVDAECPDFLKYPLFRFALPGQVSVLLPGDILFIPKKWWHFLRALDTSISVNVWWR